MKRMSPIFKTAAAIIGLFMLLSPLCAENTSAQVTVESMEDTSGEVFRMKITPAAEPSPTFKHRFTVMPRETIAANAATLYLRSFGESSLSGPRDAAYKKYGDEFYDWQSNSGVSIEKLLETAAPEASKLFDSYIKNHIERATKCRYCDWGLGNEDLKGPEAIEFVLPSVQGTRSISSALALQTRVAIAQKRFDRAIELMRMNYQLGRNVNKMKFLVSSLVAIAEVGIANGTLIDLIAAPDSPNMYWALTELPRPVIDVRDSFRLDTTMINALLPGIFAAEAAEYGVQGWKSKTSEIVESAFYYSSHFRTGSGLGPAKIESEPDLKQLALKLAPMGVGLMAYGEAKRELLNAGEDPQKVEAMPVAQVVTVVMARDIAARSQKVERWIYQPFDVAWKGLRQEEEEMRNLQGTGMLHHPGEAIAGMLLPAGQQVYAAQMRIQRDIDALRVIEAIRMHAAETGTLPGKLDDISVVPVPLNPATGKPFSYQLKGDTATLELPRSDGITFSKRFEIRL